MLPKAEKIFPSGIISAVQTPFNSQGEVDLASLVRLLNDAVCAGVDGFLAPVVAGEVDTLSFEEKKSIIDTIASTINGKTAIIVGASSNDAKECRKMAEYALSSGACGYLVAVPNALYNNADKIYPFFKEVSDGIRLPLMIQDFQFNGKGLDIETIGLLKDKLPSFAGIKIETTPAGPKYTQVRNCFGEDFFIAGGWAVQQFIEALDRGVDAMIPESSMIRIYKKIERLYKANRRQEAVGLFRRLLPILAFTNQDVATSILFFKQLLIRKGIFSSAYLRIAQPAYDQYSEKITQELITLYLELEAYCV